jgi:uncharacterized MnhB-related membrane protein
MIFFLLLSLSAVALVVHRETIEKCIVDRTLLSLVCHFYVNK